MVFFLFGVGLIACRWKTDSGSVINRQMNSLLFLECRFRGCFSRLFRVQDLPLDGLRLGERAWNDEENESGNVAGIRVPRHHDEAGEAWACVQHFAKLRAL
jgi:hypothetical protein